MAVEKSGWEMLEPTGSPAYRRSFRILVILVVSYLPVAGLAGVIGWTVAHSLMPLVITAALYLLAIALFGFKAWRARS
jgi:hypothetical protein